MSSQPTIHKSGAHRKKLRELPEPFTEEWVKSGFNALNPNEARELIHRTQEGEFDLDNIRSHVKALIGMSWDSEFDEIRKGLWALTDMLTVVKLVNPKAGR
jgi:hypothetical protein